MLSTAATPEAYVASLPEDRREAVAELRKVIKKNLPAGFQEVMSSGMIGYVVPHSAYPDGYHCNPDQPLPFMCLADQKNYIALYHMGLYGDPDLLDWFQQEYARQVKTRLDMGKSCIRFKKPAEIPFALIGQLASKVTVKKWIGQYEKSMKR